MSSQRIGTYLLNQGLLSQEQLTFCLGVQKNNGGARIGQVLKHYNFVTELDVARALAHQVGWQMFSGSYVLDKPLADLLGWEFIQQRGIFPVKDAGIVLSSVDDTSLTDDINEKLKQKTVFYLGIESQIRKALSQYGEHHKSLAGNGNELLTWINVLIERALLLKASDIHIEPSAKAVEIRFRVDGVLVFVDSLKLSQLSRLVNVIFNLAGVTVSDFYHFHDARFSYLCLDHELDIRLSHLPSIFGSALVLRILDKNKVALGLKELGYSQRHWDLIEENLLKPDGVSLIVGPTGCGKTTSLYAMLNYLKSISRKIVTVEDPVEVRLSLTTQLQVQEKRGIGFGESVRAFLRHDPDIILIGEIRDQETAQEAMRAAMTGHKVFSTLHTTRAIDALLRLNDLGIQSHYIAHCLTMVMAQRLVRKLCGHCKRSRLVERSGLKPYYQRFVLNAEQEIFDPVGCQYCRGGYEGRLVVAEILSIDEVMRRMMIKGDWGQLYEQLEGSASFISFQDDARRLILEGVTGLEEMMRVLG